MDTITHGIAGALIGKAVFGGEDLFTRQPLTQRRVAAMAATLGAIFPDVDIVRDVVSRDPMTLLTWHRSWTHSLVMLPAFALGLAALTRYVARKRAISSPSFALLLLIYAVGIGRSEERRVGKECTSRRPRSDERENVQSAAAPGHETDLRDEK